MKEGCYIEGNMPVQSIIQDILTGIQRIEKTISEKLDPVERYIEKKNEYDYVLKYGLEGFRERIIKSSKKNNENDTQEWLIHIIQRNPSLRFPHRKILEYLSKQYDYEKKRFKEVNFSTIVKECRLGKNRAGEYLELLEEKGIVKKRKDGYRVWYKLAAETI